MNLDLQPKTRVVFDPLEMSVSQRKLVLALGRGLPNRAIAEELGKSEGAVKVQLFELFRKSGMGRLRLAMLGARMLEAMAS